MPTDLKQDHNRIRSLLSQLEAMVAHDHPPPVGDLADVRRALFTEHREHVQREDAFVQTRLGKSALTHARCCVIESIDRKIADQIRRWTGAEVHIGWNAYRADTTLLAKQLRTQMNDEEALILSLF